MDINVNRCTKLDDDRAVARVNVGPFQLGSMWVVGRASGKPRVSWPETSRGFPIVSVTDADLRERIEREVLSAVASK